MGGATGTIGTERLGLARLAETDAIVVPNGSGDRTSKKP